MQTAPQLTSEEKAEAVREYARQTMGTDAYHHLSYLKRLKHTDGVKHLAETCGAFWLCDLIESHQPKIERKHPDLADFQVWRLRADGTPQGLLIDAWSDTPGEKNLGSVRLAFQKVEYSDFPRELLPYEGLYVEGGVLLLKAER